MNALEIVQQAADTLGFERPTTIGNKQDTNTTRLLGALNRALEDIVRDYDWQCLVLPHTFQTTQANGEGFYYTNSENMDGYDIDEMLPMFDYFVTDYLYDLTDNIKINSVTYDRNNIDWMFRRDSGHPSFVFVQNVICFLPDIPRGHNISFYYKSRACVYNNETNDDGRYERKDYFNNNLDRSYIDSQLLLRGLLWKYKFETGADYSESYRDYEKFLNKLKDQDSNRRRIGGQEYVCDLRIAVDSDGRILE